MDMQAAAVPAAAAPLAKHPAQHASAILLIAASSLSPPRYTLRVYAGCRKVGVRSLSRSARIVESPVKVIQKSGCTFAQPEEQKKLKGCGRWAVEDGFCIAMLLKAGSQWSLVSEGWFQLHVIVAATKLQ